MARVSGQSLDSRSAMVVNIEEIKFWLTNLQEHVLFIKTGLPAERKEALSQAHDVYRSFDALLIKADTAKTAKQFNELIRQSAEKIDAAYQFKRQLLLLSLRGELATPLYPLFLDHLSREAEYCLRMLESMSEQRRFSLWPKPKELSFWLRLMEEHSLFIRQMLDASESTLINSAETSAKEFNSLFRQAIDFSSILQGFNYPVPTFKRFLQDSRAAAMRLRNFSHALHTMVIEKKVMGVLSPLFIEHVYQEAEHFFMIAAMLENEATSSQSQQAIVDKSLPEYNNPTLPETPAVIEPLDSSALAVTEALPEQPVTAPAVPPSQPLASIPETESLTPESAIMSTPERPPSSASTAADDDAPSKKPTKWGMSWPRPLGKR